MIYDNKKREYFQQLMNNLKTIAKLNNRIQFDGIIISFKLR